MHVLFYEPSHTGHHYAYLARMLPGFLDLPVRITIATTQQGLDSEEFKKTLAPFVGKVEFFTLCVPFGGGVLRNAIHRVREIRSVVKQLKPDHVCVVYLDGIWQILAVLSWVWIRLLPKSAEYEGWLYRGDFANPRKDSWRSKLRRMLFRSFLRSKVFAKLHIVHEQLHAMISEMDPSTIPQFSLCPESVWVGDRLSVVDARRALGMREDGRWIVGAGNIDARKGMDLLLAAYDGYTRLNPQSDAKLLLAGPHAPQIVEMLSSHPYKERVESGQILSINRYLNEQEMYQCVAAGDVTVAPYPNHSGRSSIILWAAVAGRRSLGTDWGCIGYVIRSEKLGLTCDVLNADEFVTALDKILELDWTEADQERVRAYGMTHSIENYQRESAALLRSRIELGD